MLLLEVVGLTVAAVAVAKAVLLALLVLLAMETLVWAQLAQVKLCPVTATFWVV
jgi:hypothetical protein